MENLLDLKGFLRKKRLHSRHFLVILGVLEHAVHSPLKETELRLWFCYLILGSIHVIQEYLLLFTEIIHEL